jgi:hypothetical protein
MIHTELNSKTWIARGIEHHPVQVQGNQIVYWMDGYCEWMELPNDGWIVFFMHAFLYPPSPSCL